MCWCYSTPSSYSYVPTLHASSPSTGGSTYVRVLPFSSCVELATLVGAHFVVHISPHIISQKKISPHINYRCMHMHVYQWRALLKVPRQTRAITLLLLLLHFIHASLHCVCSPVTSQERLGRLRSPVAKRQLLMHPADPRSYRCAYERVWLPRLIVHES